MKEQMIYVEAQGFYETARYPVMITFKVTDGKLQASARCSPESDYYWEKVEKRAKRFVETVTDPGDLFAAAYADRGYVAAWAPHGNAVAIKIDGHWVVGGLLGENGETLAPRIYAESVYGGPDGALQRWQTEYLMRGENIPAYEILARYQNDTVSKHLQARLGFEYAWSEQDIPVLRPGHEEWIARPEGGGTMTVKAVNGDEVAIDVLVDGYWTGYVVAGCNCESCQTFRERGGRSDW